MEEWFVRVAENIERPLAEVRDEVFVNETVEQMRDAVGGDRVHADDDQREGPAAKLQNVDDAVKGAAAPSTLQEFVGNASALEPAVTAAKHNAVLVSRQAILTDGSTVMTLDDTNRVHRLPIVVGLQNDEFVEILSGLDSGQRVATSGLTDMTEGDVVAPTISALMANEGAR
jgi:hypothetical protein